MIETHGLTRSFGAKLAVDRLDLRVEAGEVFGFLGPNGAGKTTTMKMLTGLLLPSAGSARIAGLDVVADSLAVKRVLGFMPDTPLLYDFLTPREQLQFLADVHGVGDAPERIRDLLAELDLSDKADSLQKELSHGMRKKVAFAAARIHAPKLLILDEPTSGLDPRSVRVFRETLRRLASEGTTVLLSTHVLELVERLCDRVAIMFRGRLRAVGTPAELLAGQGRAAGELEDVFLELTAEPDEAAGDEPRGESPGAPSPDPGGAEAPPRGPDEPTP